MKNELAEKVVLLKKRIDFLKHCKNHLLDQKKKECHKIVTSISFMSSRWLELFKEQHFRHCEEALDLVNIELSHNESKLENL